MEDKIYIIRIAIFRIEAKMNVGICAALVNSMADFYRNNNLKFPAMGWDDTFLKNNFKRIEIIAAKYEEKIKPDFYDSRFWWNYELIDVRLNVLKEYLKELEDDNK